MKQDNAIEVKNVSKSFKLYYDKGRSLKEIVLFSNRRRFERRVVISDLSFEVKKGESLGLIGENGCGKSTTLKLLTKIMYPDSGTIEMAGRVSSLLELGAGFHPDMTGRQNIYTNASIFGLTRREIDRRIDDIIEFSELGEYIDNPVRTYSSGMYTRLAFAVSINVDADILLIDEILAVGDANFQAKCFNWLNELKKRGVTIVIVSHDTGAIERFCDKAIWINEGKSVIYDTSTKVIDTYLRYMNDKKMKSLEEQNKEATVEEEQLENISADINEENFGSKDIVIEKAYFTDTDGKEMDVLQSGDTYQINIEYYSNKKVEECIFGFGIYTLNEECIMNNNTYLDRVIIKGIKEKGKVKCVLKNIPLLTGKYFLSLNITDKIGQPMDYYRDYLHFDVVSNERSVGIVDIKHEWIV